MRRKLVDHDIHNRGRIRHTRGTVHIRARAPVSAVGKRALILAMQTVAGRHQSVPSAVRGQRPAPAVAIRELGDDRAVGADEAYGLAAVGELAAIGAGQQQGVRRVALGERCRVPGQHDGLAGREPGHGTVSKGVVDAAGKGDLGQVQGVAAAVEELDELELVGIGNPGDHFVRRRGGRVVHELGDDEVSGRGRFARAGVIDGNRIGPDECP